MNSTTYNFWFSPHWCIWWWHYIECWPRLGKRFYISFSLVWRFFWEAFPLYVTCSLYDYMPIWLNDLQMQPMQLSLKPFGVGSHWYSEEDWEDQDDLIITYIYIIYFIYKMERIKMILLKHTLYIIYFIYKIERIKVMFLVDFITVSGTWVR